LLFFRRFKWRYVLPYIFFQTLGAFAAAAIVYGVWYDGINNFDHGHRQVVGPFATAGIFANYPIFFLTNRGGFIDQMVETFLFIICIFAILDSKNNSPGARWNPFFIGFSLFLIGISFGALTGFAVNPARDFGPRAFSAIVYGHTVFSSHNNFWWIPIVGPFTGVLIGGFFYDFFVKWHHPRLVAKPINKV